jgi:hypothetical protein
MAGPWSRSFVVLRQDGSVKFRSKASRLAPLPHQDRS